MRKLISLTVLVIVLAGLAFSGASAQTGQPASKVTAKVGDIAILDSTGMEWKTILSNNLKTANQKDLFVDVSLECGLYTSTKVASAGKTDTSVADAGVQVQVLVDGKPILPGPVTFCRRTQTLTALFGGIMNSCKDLNGDGTITNDECTWTNEELELVLETMNANSFNFIQGNLLAGTHTIDVQARIDTDHTAMAGTADAKATIGKGSVTVESVRMIQDEDFELE